MIAVATHKSSIILSLVRRVDNDATVCAQCGKARRPLFRYGRRARNGQGGPLWDAQSYCNRECRSLAQAATL